MIQLKDTTIYRGGSKAQQWYSSHKGCEFKISPKNNSLQFFFSIPSKGGGTTDIKLDVGPRDIATICNKIVESMSDNVRVVPKFVVQE